MFHILACGSLIVGLLLFSVFGWILLHFGYRIGKGERLYISDYQHARLKAVLLIFSSFFFLMLTAVLWDRVEGQEASLGRLVCAPIIASALIFVFFYPQRRRFLPDSENDRRINRNKDAI